MDQCITFSGVGAHHQNGKAERTIQTVVDKARSMLLHISIHWPKAFSMELWPFTMYYAVFIYHHTPRTVDGVTPIEHRGNSYMNCKHLAQCKVSSYPVYILAAKLQDDKKISKWKL
jgi:hypothetical protein